MLLKASPKFTEPFSISQITRNVSIGRAARREMDVASSFGGAVAESYAAMSGYLHWFTRADDARPVDSLALGRSAIEEGKAPRFNILETPKGAGWLSNIRARRVSFQAASVEECCEWAIAIREAIAVAAGKQLVFEEEGGVA
ncbi:hypothetical protein GPECTOR_1g573 [Gonium pectorale]|uniref:PH domain-containing protein n=1 Tax=Gonium pectorale TaxID=33097 RepID=A0A150H389_GONPE|nr:hypothetical protein GPECTOR_1g573 [Gonium pectorale]|eukprot:KXZ56636.1 hypothetical protein GPECTOR_1g573 [Gonium pectorale]